MARSRVTLRAYTMAPGGKVYVCVAVDPVRAMGAGHVQLLMGHGARTWSRVGVAPTLGSGGRACLRRTGPAATYRWQVVGLRTVAPTVSNAVLAGRGVPTVKAPPVAPSPSAGQSTSPPPSVNQSPSPVTATPTPKAALTPNVDGARLLVPGPSPTQAPTCADLIAAHIAASNGDRILKNFTRVVSDNELTKAQLIHWLATRDGAVPAVPVASHPYIASSGPDDRFHLCVVQVSEPFAPPGPPSSGAVAPPADGIRFVVQPSGAITIDAIGPSDGLAF